MDMPVNPTIPAMSPVADAATSVAVDDGATVVNPTVAAPSRPKVEGEDFIDRGEAAEIEILHARVGTFRQGDRVTVADLGPNVDIDRLVRLEAVNVLKAPAPADAPQGKPKGK